MPEPIDAVGSMRALAAELRAAGLSADVHETQGVVDVRASLDRPGCKTIEVIADDDGYIEIRFWHQPDAAPAQIAATITSALTAIVRGTRTT